MEKTLVIGGEEIKMRASALIPRIYRFKFGRDLIRDMKELERNYKKAASLPDNASEEERQESQLSVLDLTIFENIAWTMCKAADPNIPEDPDEWLDAINGVFSIYEVLPEILALWTAGMATTSEPIKK